MTICRWCKTQLALEREVEKEACITCDRLFEAVKEKATIVERMRTEIRLAAEAEMLKKEKEARERMFQQQQERVFKTFTQRSRSAAEEWQKVYDEFVGFNEKRTHANPSGAFGFDFSTAQASTPESEGQRLRRLKRTDRAAYEAAVEKSGRLNGEGG